MVTHLLILFQIPLLVQAKKIESLKVIMKEFRIALFNRFVSANVLRQNFLQIFKF